jgi:hypothetical protein
VQAGLNIHVDKKTVTFYITAKSHSNLFRRYYLSNSTRESAGFAHYFGKDFKSGVEF